MFLTIFVTHQVHVSELPNSYLLTSWLCPRPMPRARTLTELKADADAAADIETYLIALIPTAFRSDSLAIPLSMLS